MGATPIDYRLCTGPKRSLGGMAEGCNQSFAPAAGRMARGALRGELFRIPLKMRPVHLLQRGVTTASDPAGVQLPPYNRATLACEHGAPSRSGVRARKHCRPPAGIVQTSYPGGVVAAGRSRPIDHTNVRGAETRRVHVIRRGRYGTGTYKERGPGWISDPRGGLRRSFGEPPAGAAMRFREGPPRVQLWACRTESGFHVY